MADNEVRVIFVNVCLEAGQKNILISTSDELIGQWLSELV